MVNLAPQSERPKPRFTLRPNPLDLGAAAVGFGLLVYGVGRLSVEGGFILAGALLIAGALSSWRRNPE